MTHSYARLLRRNCGNGNWQSSNGNWAGGNAGQTVAKQGNLMKQPSQRPKDQRWPTSQWLGTKTVALSPLPALLKRQDGATILYAGKLNWLFGIPGSGKSWVAIIAANEAILCGGRVLIMDYEDSKATFQRRAALIGLNPALHADNMIYAAPGLTDSPTARAEAQQWLADAMDASMSLVVIDSAESSGCPSDGDNVNPWIGKMVQPWRDVGTGVLVIDHQPKRSEDRPLGPIGSQRKLAAVDGAALECSGLPWTKAKAGKIILANHKDRGGDLDAAVRKALAVIVETYAGEGDARAFGYTIEQPEQQEDVASLSIQILDAVIDAGTAGIGSLTKLRRMVKGKGAAIDATIEELIRAGYLAPNKARTSQYLHCYRRWHPVAIRDGIVPTLSYRGTG